MGIISYIVIIAHLSAAPIHHHPIPFHYDCIVPDFVQNVVFQNGNLTEGIF